MYDVPFIQEFEFCAAADKSSRDPLVEVHILVASTSALSETMTPIGFGKGDIFEHGLEGTPNNIRKGIGN